MGAALEFDAMLIGLVGGLALFLFGMEQMTGALKLLAGEGLKRLLARLTTNRFSAALAGALTTAVIQSSSVTTVLVVGFISAGLMTLQQSIGVIMGANIGTTVTAQIIAFKVTRYALVLVAIGFGMLFTGRRERIRQYGTMIMGLGLIFFGMQMMSDATRPLRSYAPFIELMHSMEHPAVGILVSAIFTGIIQSSSATTGVIIVLAQQGYVTLEAGIALAFGANVGTCITALLAAIGKPREAVRAAAVHVVFNVLGVLVWLAFIDELAHVVRLISPVAEGVSGIERLGLETPRQIANAHTVFNVANTLLFIGLVGPIAALVVRLVPDRAEAVSAQVQPRYLDDLLLDTPALALDRARMELSRLCGRVLPMVESSLHLAMRGSHESLDALEQADEDVDVLHAAVVGYLGRLSREGLRARHAAELYTFLQAANSVENLADMVETNIVGAGRARLASGLVPTMETETALAALHARVLVAVEQSFEALGAIDLSMAERVVAAKSEIAELAERADARLNDRLAATNAERLVIYRVEAEVIEYLKRVYYFARQVAKGVILLETSDLSGDAEEAIESVLSA